MGEHLPYKQRVIGSSPIAPTIFARVAQLVERYLAKVNVAGSSPVSRSTLKLVRVLYGTRIFVSQKLYALHTPAPKNLI